MVKQSVDVHKPFGYARSGSGEVRLGTLPGLGMATYLIAAFSSAGLFMLTGFMAAQIVAPHYVTPVF